MSVRARLVTAQGDPQIGTERIAVHHEDGRVEEITLHDYARVYSLPGVYEQIVQDDLGCRSPQVVAEMLGGAFDELGRDRAATCIIDIAAGNGVSGEALREAGLGGRGLIGTDIVPEARAAALRDRPTVYEEYLTLDLTALDASAGEHLRGLRADALTCVSPVAVRPGAVPPDALAAAAGVLAVDALVVALHDPRHGEADVLTDEFWAAALGPGLDAERLAYRRYLHRFLVTGAPYELEASVWRLRRASS
jgi:hypothetical protein